MNTPNTYTIDSELWESGELGQDEKHVVRADSKQEFDLDESLDLQMISIRLQKKLIEDLKVISRAHGIGYQPLIRDILSRFVTHEIKQLMRDALERRKLEAKQLQEEVTRKSRSASKKAA